MSDNFFAEKLQTARTTLRKKIEKSLLADNRILGAFYGGSLGEK